MNSLSDLLHPKIISPLVPCSSIPCVLKGQALNYCMEKSDGNFVYDKLGLLFKALEAQFDTLAHPKQIEALAQSITMEETIKNTTAAE